MALDQLPTCDWPMGTVWTGPKRCGRKAKYKVTSGPLCHIVTYVCGIHERSNTRGYGASEVIK